MILDLAKYNWYGLDHEKIKGMFEGDPKYIGTFCVKDEYHPSAVYHSANPNRAKGHKDYMLLTKQMLPTGPQWYVRGMDAAEIEQYRYQDGLHCLDCDDLVYSVMRHDNRSCKCGAIAVDGGRDYSRHSFRDITRLENVTVDLLTGTCFKP
jgi:hypothetical protein